MDDSQSKISMRDLKKKSSMRSNESPSKAVRQSGLRRTTEISRMVASVSSLRSNDDIPEESNKRQWCPPIPKGKINKFVFFVFFPTIYLLWLLMPDIKSKPTFSKILLSSFQILVFSFGICYPIYRLEFMLIIAFGLKVHLVGLINGLLFSAR